MKGVDIVVHGSVGPRGRVHGAARERWSSAATPARTWATRSTRPGSTYAGRSPAWAPTASRRRWPTSTGPSWRAARGRRGLVRPGRVSPLRLGPPPLQLQRGPRGRVLMAGWRPGLRESALFDRNAIHEIQRMAREGIYDIRGFGAKRRVPHFDDLLVPRRQRLAISARGIPRALRHRRHARDTVRERADRARHPDHDRRDELRSPLGPGEGGARPRGERGGDQHDHRRRWDAARGARALDASSSTNSCPPATG